MRTAIAIGLLFGFWKIIEYVMTGISRDFGLGFAAGVAVTTVLVFMAERAGGSGSASGSRGRK